MVWTIAQLMRAYFHITMVPKQQVSLSQVSLTSIVAGVCNQLKEEQSTSPTVGVFRGHTPLMQPSVILSEPRWPHLQQMVWQLQTVIPVTLMKVLGIMAAALPVLPIELLHTRHLQRLTSLDTKNGLVWHNGYYQQAGQSPVCSPVDDGRGSSAYLLSMKALQDLGLGNSRADIISRHCSLPDNWGAPTLELQKILAWLGKGKWTT